MVDGHEPPLRNMKIYYKDHFLSLPLSWKPQTPNYTPSSNSKEKKTKDNLLDI